MIAALPFQILFNYQFKTIDHQFQIKKFSDSNKSKYQSGIIRTDMLFQFSENI